MKPKTSTRQRIQAAIVSLKQAGISCTVTEVSVRSGVSRSTIYSHAELLMMCDRADAEAAHPYMGKAQEVLAKLLYDSEHKGYHAGYIAGRRDASELIRQQNEKYQKDLRGLEQEIHALRQGNPASQYALLDRQTVRSMPHPQGGNNALDLQNIITSQLQKMTQLKEKYNAAKRQIGILEAELSAYRQGRD